MGQIKLINPFKFNNYFLNFYELQTQESMVYRQTKRRRLSRGRFRIRRRRFFGRSRRLKSFIKRVVNRMSETKWATRNTGQITITNQDGSGIGHFQEIIPPTTQGPDTHQRIGENIRTRYLTIHLNITFNANSIITQSPFRIVLLRPLKYNNFVDVPTFVNFTMDQSSGPSSYLGTFNNKNVQVLYDRTYIFGTADTWQQSGRPAIRNFSLGRRLSWNISYDRNASIPNEPRHTLILLFLWPGINPPSPPFQWEASFQCISRLSYKDV